MDIFDIFLTETPIEDLSLIGNWDKNSAFGTRDRKLLTNPKAQAKIIQKWEKVIVPFNILMVNTPEAFKFYEVGHVSTSWLEQNMPKTYPELEPHFSEDAVNVIYNGNKGSPKAPMTAWVIAHRFGHTLFPYGTNNSYGREGWRPIEEFSHARYLVIETFGSILEDAYGFSNMPKNERQMSQQRRTNIDKIFTGLMREVGTMRSARERDLVNELEFIFECLAQYMMTGSVKFNSLPKKFRYSYDQHGRSMAYMRSYNENDITYYDSVLGDLADNLQGTFNDMLRTCVGEIFLI